MDDKRFIKFVSVGAVFIIAVLFIAIFVEKRRASRLAVEVANQARQQAEHEGFQAYKASRPPKRMPSHKEAAWEVGWLRAESIDEQERGKRNFEKERKNREIRLEREREDALREEEELREKYEAQWDDADQWLLDEGYFREGGDYNKVIRAMQELAKLRDLATGEERVKIGGLISAMMSDLETMKCQDLERGYPGYYVLMRLRSSVGK